MRDDTAPTPTFGSILRFARKAIGMTQRALARELGVSAPYICDVEADARAPLTAERARTACRLLGISQITEAKTRAVSVGFFQLVADPRRQQQMTAGGLLSLAWGRFSLEELEQIAELSRQALARHRVRPNSPPE